MASESLGESGWRNAAAGTEEGGTENNQVDHHKSITLPLLAMSLAALAVGIVSELWLEQAGQGCPVLLPAVLALIGVIDVVWFCHARAARRLAVLDAYAEREIARLGYRQDRPGLGNPGPQTRSDTRLLPVKSSH